MKRPRGAAQGLAVDAQHGQKFVLRVGEMLQHPFAEDAVEGLGIKRLQQVAEAVFLGRPALEPQLVDEVNGSIVQPFDQLRVISYPAQQTTYNSRQHGGQRMTYSLTPAWIRNLRQMVKQAPRGRQHGKPSVGNNQPLPRKLAAILPASACPTSEWP